MRPVRPKTLISSGAICLLGLRSISCPADSWVRARASDAASDSGKFIAHIVPGNEGTKPLLIVSAFGSGKTNELWRAELDDVVSPGKVWVADDGKSVVAANLSQKNNAVIAIYSRQGEMHHQYRLADLVPLAKPSPGRISGSPGPAAYEDKFGIAASGGPWFEKCVAFFREDHGQMLFCLWIGWANRWVAWEMKTGAMLAVTKADAKMFDKVGRQRILNQARNDILTETTLNFLGRLRFKEDRLLVESWLRDTNFGTGVMQSSVWTEGGGEPKTTFAFTASSQKRNAADKILSRWEGMESTNKDLFSAQTHHFLGSLKCVVVLPVIPSYKDGSVRVYLLPESVPLKKWASERPVYHLSGSLDGYPNTVENEATRNSKSPRDMNCWFYGVTPGRYRLKAVWYKVPPFAKLWTVICIPNVGDYESVTSPVISIEKGATAEGVRVECDHLVEK